MLATADAPDSITRLLVAWQQGDERALAELVPLVYQELRRLAGRHLRRERDGHTLETRDLLHEAFLRLAGQRQADWQNRAHFFAIAAESMRRILVDHARRRRTARHGGDLRRVTLGDDLALPGGRGVDLVALDEALAEFAGAAPTLARIVELRFFGGLDHAAVAAVLGTSKATVRRRWEMARAWLYRRLSDQEALRV